MSQEYPWNPDREGFGHAALHPEHWHLLRHQRRRNRVKYCRRCGSARQTARAVAIAARVTSATVRAMWPSSPGESRALEIHPAYADAHYNLTDTLEQEGRFSEARRHWKEYLRPSPRTGWTVGRLREAAVGLLGDLTYPSGPLNSGTRHPLQICIS